MPRLKGIPTMVPAHQAPNARTSCPSCHARLRLNTELPEGTSVRCPGCKSTFSYSAHQAGVPAARTTRLAGATSGREKELHCPGCAWHFWAEVPPEGKVRCPGCHKSITVRRSVKTRLAPMDQTPVPQALQNASPAPPEPERKPPRLIPTGFEEPKKKRPPLSPVKGNDLGWMPVKSTTKKAAKSKPAAMPLSPRKVGLAVLVLLGCGYPLYAFFFAGELPRVVVSGKITCEGKPVVHGTVLFQGDDGIAQRGAIRPDGSYVVTGVPQGTVRIGVVSPNPAQEPGSGGQPAADGDEGETAWFPIAENLGIPGQSGLTVQVHGDTSHHIELPGNPVAN